MCYRWCWRIKLHSTFTRSQQVFCLERWNESCCFNLLIHGHWTGRHVRKREISFTSVMEVLFTDHQWSDCLINPSHIIVSSHSLGRWKLLVCKGRDRTHWKSCENGNDFNNLNWDYELCAHAAELWICLTFPADLLTKLVSRMQPTQVANSELGLWCVFYSFGSLIPIKNWGIFHQMNISIRKWPKRNWKFL